MTPEQHVPPRQGTVLVTGGAGYIGSHTTLALLDAGWPVVVIDNLSTGRREVVPDGVELVVGDVVETDLVRRTMVEREVRAVMHFAGSIVVPESVSQPLDYYANNTAASRALIEAAVAEDVDAFVFSSTAAVYGTPAALPVAEDAPCNPANPYGRSKLMTEWMLEDTHAAHGLAYAALRYFNVAGADPDGRSGQTGPQSTHLIKVAAETVVGHRESMSVFGTDYDTPDGTCIRDYIHVSDLAEAHVAALDHLLAGHGPLVANCGYGHGFSVRQVLAAVEAATGQPLPVIDGPRRAGDVAELVADASRIRETLGWRPRHDDLDFIVRTALEWETRLTGLREAGQ